jgi:hypothetical protein
MQKNRNFCFDISYRWIWIRRYVFYDTLLSPSLGLKAEEITVTQWYMEDFDYSFSGTSEEYIDPMSLTITISEPSTLYILFNAYVRFPTDNSLFLHIRIDDTQVSQEMRVRAENVVVVERYSVALQHFSDSLSSGTYNISIWARVGAIPANLYEMSLYIQTKS